MCIALLNGATQGLLGFPNIGAIASVDNISIATGFPLTERLFMMAVTGLMMLPFFKQLVVRCVSYTIDSRIFEIRKTIVESALKEPKSVRTLLQQSQQSGVHYWLNLLTIVDLL